MRGLVGDVVLMIRIRSLKATTRIIVLELCGTDGKVMRLYVWIHHDSATFLLQ